MYSRTPLSVIVTAFFSFAFVSLLGNAAAAVDRSKYACVIFDKDGKFQKGCGRAYCTSSCRCRTNPRHGKDEFRFTCDDTKKPPTEEVVRMIGGFIMHKDAKTLKWQDKCNCFPSKKPDILRPVRPRKDSNCCKQCQSYGCHVNNGRIDAMTPCDPTGKKTGTRTWVNCTKSGCGSEGCGTCTCEPVVGKDNVAAIEWDIIHTSLFYAGGPTKGGPTACLRCGDADVGKRNCKATGEFCRSSSQCCKQSIPRSNGKCSWTARCG